MMDISIVFWSVFLFAASIAAKHPLHPLSDEFISLINSKQNSWIAGRNFAPETSLTYMKMLTGGLKDPNLHMLPSKVHNPDLIASLPENFDPRDKWPNCSTLNEIQNQGCCWNGWVMGAVAAMRDRICISSNGTKNVHVSANDVMWCGGNTQSCLGDHMSRAWNYWKNNGIVSGGPYNSSQGCMPNIIRPFKFLANGFLNYTDCDGRIWGNIPCLKICRPGYDVKYDQDKHFGKNVYKIKGEDHIKAELFSNGPVQAELEIFEDFLFYKSGVYDYTSGKRLGLHAIKVMGWGVEDGKKYWLCANSWGSQWGLKGFVKILSDDDAGNIEDVMIAGEPVLAG